jgi:hypothetical protein
MAYDVPMNRNRITKSSAIGYAIDSTLENLIEDFRDHCFDDTPEERESTIALIYAIIRHAPRAQRKFWEGEMLRRPLP